MAYFPTNTVSNTFQDDSYFAWFEKNAPQVAALLNGEDFGGMVNNQDYLPGSENNRPINFDPRVDQNTSSTVKPLQTSLNDHSAVVADAPAFDFSAFDQLPRDIQREYYADLSELAIRDSETAVSVGNFSAARGAVSEATAYNDASEQLFEDDCFESAIQDVDLNMQKEAKFLQYKAEAEELMAKLLSQGQTTEASCVNLDITVRTQAFLEQTHNLPVNEISYIMSDRSSPFYVTP